MHDRRKWILAMCTLLGPQMSNPSGCCFCCQGTEHSLTMVCELIMAQHDWRLNFLHVERPDFLLKLKLQFTHTHSQNILTIIPFLILKNKRGNIKWRFFFPITSPFSHSLVLTLLPYSHINFVHLLCVPW